MKEILLTKSKVALVDNWEYERLRKHSWHASLYRNTYYALTGNGKTQARVKMHHLVLPLLPGLEVDHIDGNGLNNQRENLRLCTSSQNSMNQRPQLGTTSRYKGVCWDKARNKWEAKIVVKNKTIHLGRFKVEKDAALVYNVAAIKYFGQFAYLNTTNDPINREELMEKLIQLEKI